MRVVGSGASCEITSLLTLTTQGRTQNYPYRERTFFSRQKMHLMMWAISMLTDFPHHSTRGLIFLLCFFLFVAPPPLIAQTSIDNSPPIDGLDHTFALAEYDLNQIEEARFDIAALQQKIGNTPNLLTNWVRSQTRWVPYLGALKGAPGTLLARQGNLLDRSLLLAALLEASGRQTRIAWFETTSKQKQVLRAAVSHQNAGERSDFFQADNHSKLNQAADSLSGDGRPRLVIDRVKAERALRIKIRNILSVQHDQLTALTSKYFDPADSSSGNSSLKRYFYVEHRTPENVEWDSEHLHPEMQSTGQEIHRFSPRHVPAKFLHSVTVRIVVVKDQSGILTQSVALEESIAVARLGTTKIRLGMSPIKKQGLPSLINSLYQSKNDGPLLRYLSLADSWAPTIRIENRQPVIGKIIRADGDVTVTPENLPGTSSGANLSTTLEKLDLLSGSATENQDSSLHAVRVEFVIQSPGGGNAKTITRPIYLRNNQHPPGLTQSERVARSAALSFRANFLITGGFFSMAYARVRQAQEYLKLRLAYRYLEKKDKDDWISRGDDMSPVITLLEKLDVFPTKLYGIAALRSASNIFINRPNVLGYWKHVHFDSPDSAYVLSAVDLIENGISSIDHTAQDAFNAQLLSGLRDTIIETAVESRTQQAVSTSSLFQKDQGLGWLLIQPGDLSPLQTLELPTVAQEAIQRDLAANYLVILRSDFGEDSVAWWRLNARTGELLGMSGSRHRIGGQSLTEKLVIGAAVTWVVGLLVDTLLDVSDSPCHPAGLAPSYNFLTRHLKSGVAKFWEEAEAIPGVGQCGEAVPLENDDGN